MINLKISNHDSMQKKPQKMKDKQQLLTFSILSFPYLSLD